ncbi:MAG: hypothetical protein ACJ8LG_17810 [Massilia sp.]
MNFKQHPLTSRVVSALLCGVTLVACGGGSGTAPGATQSVTAAGDPSAAAAPATTAALTSISSSTSSTSLTSGSITDFAMAPITTVRLENTNLQAAQSNVPFTFGQVFVLDHLHTGVFLSGQLDDGTTIPLQIDVKVTNPDGSIRHAIISGVVPNLPAGAVRTISLMRSGTPQPAPTATPQSLLAAGFNASVRANIAGVEYSAAADQLLQTAKVSTWLSGPVANEWQVSAPLVTAAGVAHPHLSARFAVRYYEALKQARVDVTVENDWAYEPAPQNFTYDAKVVVGGTEVYTKPALTHLHHARWRKVFWWGGNEPQLNIKHNTGYLIASKALPNFDQSLIVPETALAALKTKWTGTRTEPMGAGLAVPYMPTTGGRDDIGLLPGWAAVYLLSMDKRAKEVTFGTADLAGSWSSHYRDKNTDRPISLVDYPYMTILGHTGDTYNPVTKKYEAFPACATTTACTSPNTHDSSHQPAFAYLPYLVTGDYYYLEELQFWTMWNLLSYNPAYRQNIAGLLNADQVRGQAWSLRSLSEAAAITPDADPLKAQFATFLSNNLDWYNTTYSSNASSNVFGALLSGAFAYSNGTGISPWQDDFFTSAVGHTAELGFEKANTLLAWKAKFSIMRMTDPGICWIDGALYSIVLRDTSTSPLYTNISQAADKSETTTFRSLACASSAMASFLGLKVGEMTGYSGEPTGYPSNMQPALAFAATVGGAGGQAAWTRFMSRTVKPNYSTAPQFAIIPR